MFSRLFLIKFVLLIKLLNLVKCTDNIKISIIIPAYNTDQYIERCLQSAINQNLKEIDYMY